MRKALELVAGLDGSTTASYASQLLSGAIKNDIKDSPVLLAKWAELEKEAMLNESWDKVVLPKNLYIEEQQKMQVQKGWFLSGDNASNYITGKDVKVLYKGKGSGFIHSKKSNLSGFGTLMQQTHILSYIGKKLDFSAVVKTNNVAKWAGVWVRIDDEDMQCLWFDNMEDRPISGTTNWKRYHISFDVPDNSTLLNFGVLLVGEGNVWISDVRVVELSNNKNRSVDDLDVSLSF
jgi:hypothetical protein